MIEKLSEIIKYHSEDVHVDFKSHEYPLGNHAKKNEILKDISGMANHPSNEPKYILIGVKEKNGMASEFIDVITLTDQANYQQFIEENIEPRINFEYEAFEYEGHQLAAFTISNNQERPYLFKKDIRKTDDRSQDFRIGDGFIRTGTSTRKLARKDFEEIYAKRHEIKDRKSDLKITPVIRNYCSVGINDLSIFTIDFSIENLSSKSIGFNVEYKLFYKEGISLQKRFKFEDKFKKKGLEEVYPQYFTPKIDSTMFDLEIEEQQDSYKVSRLSRINEKYAVTISQRDLNTSVFLDEILVLCLPSKCDDCKISVELTLRSDDFIAGPLVKKYPLNLKNKTSDT